MAPHLSSLCCPFLETLPIEIRLQIYAHLLTYPAPLKRRQVIPGSRDLAILRVNRQVHDEALEVLYEVNTIVVTRNDFCPLTPPHLKTPLPTALARTLHLSAFSQSIACTLLAPGAKCGVCRPSARGLWAALRGMPKLRAVRVDFTGFAAELRGLGEGVPGLVGREVERVDVGRGVRRQWRRLEGEEVRGLRVEAVVECEEEEGDEEERVG